MAVDVSALAAQALTSIHPWWTAAVMSCANAAAAGWSLQLSRSAAQDATYIHECNMRSLRDLTALTKHVSECTQDALRQLERGGQVQVSALSGGCPAVGQPFGEVAQMIFMTGDHLLSAITAAARQRQQAALHRHSVELISKRSMLLTTAALNSLSKLVKQLDDPDSLEEAFSADHRMMRLRRWIISLMVLSGSPLPPMQRAEPIDDVLHSAMSSIEFFERISLLHHHEARLRLPGHVAPVVAHIVAELAANATNFSDGPVIIQTSIVGGELMIEVIDNGVGFGAFLAQANRVLAEPRSTYLDAYERGGRLGLLVTALCAERCELAVQVDHVRPQETNPGVRARIKVPSRFLLTDPPATRSFGSAPTTPRRPEEISLPTRATAQTVMPRNTSPSPLDPNRPALPTRRRATTGPSSTNAAPVVVDPPPGPDISLGQLGSTSIPTTHE